VNPSDAGTRPPRRALALAGIGALLLAAFAAWRMVPGSGTGDGDRGSIVTLADTGTAAAARARVAIPAAAHAPLPASLAGTAVDGSFTVDGAGHFVPDGNARRVFDYFLSAGGEESPEVLRGRILLHAVSSGLAESAVVEIAAVLDRYIAYQAAARATLGSGAAGSADLGARVAAMRALQRSVLGPALAKAFYGDDAALADIDMQRLAIAGNGAMTEGERQRALAALDAELPPELRDARARSSAPTTLHRKVEALRAAGGSNADIAALRRSEYGAAAAERLALLDGARAQWDRRLEAYRSEAQKLAPGGGPDSAAYRQAREALRQRHFSGTDLARVRALDLEAR